MIRITGLQQFSKRCEDAKRIYKPRLRFSEGRWFCACGARPFSVGTGSTPKGAYAAWQWLTQP